MPMYRVVIEGFGEKKEHQFFAQNEKEAEEVGKDIFFEECNYGVSEVKNEQDI